MTHRAARARLEINGNAPTADQLQAAALDSYGHFTAMQVRGGRVRGLALHLARLEAATGELFGVRLDGDQVRDYIRHALGPGTSDASVRVQIRRHAPDQPLSIAVIIRPPGGLPAEYTLHAVPYQRSVAHIKHLADFGQQYYGELAERRDFDEALLTGPDGLISEGSMTNIGFFDGHTVLWPAAPMLAGITMQLIQQDLQRQSQPARYGPVRLADLRAFTSVFVTNSRGVAAVPRIDRTELPVDTGFMAWLRESYEAAPWDEI